MIAATGRPLVAVTGRSLAAVGATEKKEATGTTEATRKGRKQRKEQPAHSAPKPKGKIGAVSKR